MYFARAVAKAFRSWGEISLPALYVAQPGGNGRASTVTGTWRFNKPAELSLVVPRNLHPSHSRFSP